jgi:branched-subunit amino acid transport protein AzlD
MKTALLIGVMALVTALTRFLPFILFRKNTPAYVSYLGRVLPTAIIGMLVVYCLKDVSLMGAPHGLPELIACACVVAVQVWRRNALISILSGTAVYMLLIRLVF